MERAENWDQKGKLVPTVKHLQDIFRIPKGKEMQWFVPPDPGQIPTSHRTSCLKPLGSFSSVITAQPTPPQLFPPLVVTLLIV